MRHGSYVFFKQGRRQFKGRISYEDGRLYLCQDWMNGTSCKEKFGHEYSWLLGSMREFKNGNNAYKITVVRKAEWNKFESSFDKAVLGYRYASNGDRKNPTYSFGCGAVKLTRNQIHSFVKDRDVYIKMNDEIDELDNQMEALRVKKQAVIQSRSLFLSKNPETKVVIDSLLSRDFNPKRINMDRIKFLFK